MTDQSGEPELIDLGVEVDDSGWNQWQNDIQKAEDSVRSLDDVIGELNARGADLGSTFDNIGEQAQAFIDQSTSDLGKFVDQLNGVGSAAETNIQTLVDRWGAADDRLQQYISDLQQAQQTQSDLSGAGAFGDTGGGEDDGSGGGGPGGLFGVARGVRAGAGIGRLVGAGPETTGALTGAADIIYLQQAFQKLQDVVPNLIDSITAASPAAQDLSAALTAMGVEGAATLAVLGPLAVAIAAVAAAVVVWNAEMDKSKTLVEGALTQQDDYYKAIQKGTTESLTKDLQDTQQHKKDLDEQLKNTQDALTSGETQAFNQYGALAATLYDASPAAGELKTKVADLTKQSVEASAQIAADQDALKSPQVKTNDAADAQKLHDQELIDSASRIATLRKDEVTDLQGTSDAIKKREDALIAERGGLSDQIDILKKSGDTSDTVTKKINDYTDQMNVLDDRIVNINSHLPEIIKGEQDAAQAKQDAAEAAKKQTEAIAEANRENAQLEASIKQVVAAQDAYNKAIQTAQENAVNSINNAISQEQTAEQQYTEGSIQDTYKRQTIGIEAERQRTTLEEDTANKIADTRTKLGEDELSITTAYNRQIFDDQIKYQQDTQKAQTEANNTNATDLQNHLDKLNQIQRDASQNELDDIQNRDFQKLAKDQQSEQNKTSDENTSYSQREAALQTHLQQQEAALATNLANTEAQQKRDEERKSADAQTKADQAIDQLNTDEKRKQDVINTSEQQKLSDLTRSENEQIAVLRQGVYNKIALIQTEENQREQMAAQTDAAIVAQHAQALAQLHATAEDFSTQLNQLSQTTTVHGALGTQITPSYAGSVPATPTVTSAPQQVQQQGIDVQSIVSAIGSGIQGLFGL